MSRLFEELSLNAWPALQTLHYDGWILRLAAGYTRRANSVNPVYSSSLPLQEKIQHCESVYTEQGQDTIFKITPAVLPEGIDSVLEHLSYRREAITSLQALDLRQLNFKTLLPADASLEEQAAEEWMSHYCLFNRISEDQRRIATQTLTNIISAKTCIALKYGGETVAVGLAVRERGYIGLFDIVTAPQWRGQGWGTYLVGSLLDWGRREGAHSAYLQVMTDNAPALALYHRFDFVEQYRYWYRIKSCQETV